MAVISYAPLSPADAVRRRRVLFQDYGKKRYKDRVKREQSMADAVPAVPRGHCGKCGAHIGRGVKFHEKHCAGSGEG